MLNACIVFVHVSLSLDIYCIYTFPLVICLAERDTYRTVKSDISSSLQARHLQLSSLYMSQMNSLSSDWAFFPLSQRVHRSHSYLFFTRLSLVSRSPETDIADTKDGLTFLTLFCYSCRGSEIAVPFTTDMLTPKWNSLTHWHVGPFESQCLNITNCSGKALAPAQICSFRNQYLKQRLFCWFYKL